MVERKSAVTFKDGHTEKIVYYKEMRDGTIFATKSGFYMFRMELIPDSISGLFPTSQFYKIDFESDMTFRGNTCDDIKMHFEPISNIQEIAIDHRVEYEYLISMRSEEIKGSVLVLPNDTDETIRATILEDIIGNLNISYEKKE